jgi:hypothetical protein
LSNTTILYQGGSGGFLFFWYMMLSGKYVARLDNLNVKPNIISVADYTKMQFPQNIVPARWRTYEPNFNSQLNTNKNFPLLLLNCYNTSTNIVQNDKIIIFYTDVRTQLRLAYDKSVYIFRNVYSKNKQRIDARNHIKYPIIFNNHAISGLTHAMIDRHELSEKIYLQDFLRNDSVLRANETIEQTKFVNHWLSLHSPKAQRKLLSWP